MLSADEKMAAIYLDENDAALTHREGMVYYKDKPYNGWLFSLHAPGDTVMLVAMKHGKEEGVKRTWYPGGKISEERFYVQGKKEGMHKGWYPSGKLRFEYHFSNDEHQGEAKEWYEDGKRYRSFHYNNGSEEGLQQLWWPDGRVRANYVAKNGEQYGLIGRKLCKNTMGANAK
jgi:antitoxin component YwqK of YwqJK toxin-antitoxin module